MSVTTALAFRSTCCSEARGYRQPVIARCDLATALDLVEEPFGQVAGSIWIWAKADRVTADQFVPDEPNPKSALQKFHFRIPFLANLLPFLSVHDGVRPGLAGSTIIACSRRRFGIRRDSWHCCAVAADLHYLPLWVVAAIKNEGFDRNRRSRVRVRRLAIFTIPEESICHEQVCPLYDCGSVAGDVHGNVAIGTRRRAEKGRAAGGDALCAPPLRPTPF
jgi:hypothetical protein